jgi:alpha-tubulin suppressor-like RCC1 family protein
MFAPFSAWMNAGLAWSRAGRLIGCGLALFSSAQAAPVFTSPATAPFTRTVAGSFTAAATGDPTYSVAEKTFFESTFDGLSDDWQAWGATTLSQGALVLNPSGNNLNGSLILPKLGASSPGSFTATFDYSVDTTGGGNGTSFNYGIIAPPATNYQNGLVSLGANNGLSVNFIGITSNPRIDVTWGGPGSVIASAPVTYASTPKSVEIKLDGANMLTVRYDGVEKLRVNLAGKVNAADRTNWQFAFGASTAATTSSRHAIDNLRIASNGALPAGLSLNPSTGVISGTPTTANNPGVQAFDLVATNADGATSQLFSLALASGAPVFTSAATNPMVAGVAGTFTVAASGTAGPTTYGLGRTILSTTLADATTLPAGAYTTGSALFNNGALELTQNGYSQSGRLQFVGEGAQNPNAFTASFNYKLGGGTTVGGDNLSFFYGGPGTSSYGIYLKITEFTAVSGTPGNNTNLVLSVFNNGNAISVGNAPGALTNTSIAFPNPYLPSASGYNFLPVRLNMSDEGRLRVYINNVLAFDAGNIPNWQTIDKSLWAFGFGGVTSATTNNFHTIKDLVISTNGVVPPGLAFNTSTGVISGRLGIGTAVDHYLPILATNAAGSTLQHLKIDVSLTNLLPGQRPGTAIGGANALGCSGEQFRNLTAFAALKPDGSVKVWGNTTNGGSQAAAPTGTGYTAITSNEKAFAALKNDGSIFAWGVSTSGGTGEPTGTGYQQIYASRSAFAALKNDGSITVWGDSNGGGLPYSTTAAPTGIIYPPTTTGFIRIFANGGGFSAQRPDGTIVAWGNATIAGPSVTPNLPATTQTFGNRIVANDYFDATVSKGAFAGVRPISGATNNIITWGSASTGYASDAPGKNALYGVVDIVATSRAFAEIDYNGQIISWGDSNFGGASGGVSLAPPESGYRQIYANAGAFVGVRQDGSLTAWGSSGNGGSGAPTDTGYVEVFASLNAFAALKADGSISAWGNSAYGGTGAPSGTGYVAIYSTTSAFAAIKADGSISVWGNTAEGGTGGPTGTGWKQIASSGTAFTALKSNGTIFSWGASAAGATGEPTDTGYLTVQSPVQAPPYFPSAANAVTSLVAIQGQFTQIYPGIQGDGLSFTLSSGALPPGLTLDRISGWVYGTPVKVGAYEYTVTDSINNFSQAFTLRVEDNGLMNERQGAGAAYTIGSGRQFPNSEAFAGLGIHGTISVWGDSAVGGSGAPTDTGYTQITSNQRAFAALKRNGAIAAWGDAAYGGTGAPVATGYKQIAATRQAFAALKSDGSITAWGSSTGGGSGAPTGTGYTKIFASTESFAALKTDGSITVWGDATYLGTGTPTATGFYSITANRNAYAALKADGSITAWGRTGKGGSGAPAGTGYSQIHASDGAYAARNKNGSIAVWGDAATGGSGGPSGTNFTEVWSTANAFTALRTDGSLVSWGGVTNAPAGTGFTSVFSTGSAFAALKADGSIVSWGTTASGGSGAPAGTGYTQIFSTNHAFAALKADGSISAWGSATQGGSGAPTDTGYTQIFSRANSFTAMKADGSVVSWGSVTTGMPVLPLGSVQNATSVLPSYEYGLTGSTPGAFNTKLFSTMFAGYNGIAGMQVGAQGVGVASVISAGSLPPGVTLNGASGFLEGTSTVAGAYTFTVTSYNDSGEASRNFMLSVPASNTATVAPAWSPSLSRGYANYSIGKAVSFSLAVATPATTTQNYQVITGALPPGLAVSQSTGVVSGTPTVPGIYQFTLSATNPGGTTTQLFTIAVNDGTLPNERIGQGSSLAAQTTGRQGLNEAAFAALRPGGRIVTWGASTHGGAGAVGVPTEHGYVQITQTSRAFAALREDGSIRSWGDSGYGGSGAPTDYGYTRVYATASAFAAIKADGSITTWGAAAHGGSGGPTTTGYVQIFTGSKAMAAMKADGSITAWGDAASGGSGAPAGTGYSTITTNGSAFAALKSDGTITVWGSSTNGVTGAPTANGYIAIYSTNKGFSALHSDGTISTWGSTSAGDVAFPGGNHFVTISSNEGAYAALKTDGSIVSWGAPTQGGTGVPAGTGYTAIYSNPSAFAALTADGEIVSWGLGTSGGSGAPTGSGFTKIYSNDQAFVALKSDGTLHAWGLGTSGGTGAPTDSGYTQVFASLSAFVAQKADGSINAWGAANNGGSGAPNDTGLRIASARAMIPYYQTDLTGKLPTAYVGFAVGPDGGAGVNAYQVGAQGAGTWSRIIAGSVPGMLVDPFTGFLTGTPTSAGTYSFTVSSNSSQGTLDQVFTLEIRSKNSIIVAGGAPNVGGVFQNNAAFAALKADGSLIAWGDGASGGTGAPSGTGFTQVVSSGSAFAALKSDGSISAWGSSLTGGTGAPTGTGFVQVFSNGKAFAALDVLGGITAWGDSSAGGTGAPTGIGFTKIFSNSGAFVATKADGSLTAWGDASKGGTGAPAGTGFTKVCSTESAFAAINAYGRIVAWGDVSKGGAGVPYWTHTGYTDLFATNGAFAALRSDGSIAAWGDAAAGGTGAPTSSGFTQVFANASAFVAMKSTGAITAWGDATKGGSGAPAGTGYTKVFSTNGAFAAMKATGAITAWGDAAAGGTGAPTGTGYTQVFSTSSAFAALASDGSIFAWGDAASGGSGAPTGTGFTEVFSNNSAFAAIKADGSITAWGSSLSGGSGAPTDTGFVTVQSSKVSAPVFSAFPWNAEIGIRSGIPLFANLGAQGVGVTYQITLGSLPPGLTLDTNTGVLSGTPAQEGSFPFALAASNSSGTTQQIFTFVVALPAATVTVWPTATAITYGQTLASSTLSGGVASVDGTFAFTAPSTAPGAGTASQAVTFTPSDTVNYTPLNGTTSVLVNQATPIVTVWPTATAITYGQTLASSTLSGGTASVDGTFAFTTPSTAPDAGTASQAVTFTPSDTVNYTATIGSASVLVNKATVTVTTWPTAITYGQTLASSTLTGGVVSVDGSFGFTTPSTAPNAGTASQEVIFTPTDALNYVVASGTTMVLVNQATPIVTAWPTATAITHGQTLASSALSGGTASVNGSFVFTAPNTAPDVGTTSQAVTFTPTDAANYTNVSGTVSLTVNALIPYDLWAAAMGLDDSDAAHSSAKSADPDGDGHTNLYEFAFDGNPLSGTVEGKIVSKLAPVGADQVLTFTLPVRKGAVFSGAPALISTVIDGIDYRIEGSLDLASFTQTIREVTGNDASALLSGLPALGDGWTYRSFRVEGTFATEPRVFMRAVAREAGQ